MHTLPILPVDLPHRDLPTHERIEPHDLEPVPEPEPELVPDNVPSTRVDP